MDEKLYTNPPADYSTSPFANDGGPFHSIEDQQPKKNLNRVSMCCAAPMI